MSLKKFAVAKARALPVIILADTSGSMSIDGKISALNESLNNMVSTFQKESARHADIHVGLITFGGNKAEMHLPLAKASEIEAIQPLHATGRTPMGHAFELAIEVLEDKELITSRDYRPVLILLSDGIPTDSWQEGLERLTESERGQKASRFAMAIGLDANIDVLEKFNNDIEAPIFKANEARDIHRFFRAVTMSVTARSQSRSPNELVPVNFDELDNDDDDLGLDLEGLW
ncbi:MAG: vWA domain-containing protein [Marinomonadaceae bacterium]